MVRLHQMPHEMILFGTATSFKKIKNIDLTLRVGSDVIKPTSVGRDLGVLLDQDEITHLQGNR